MQSQNPPLVTASDEYHELVKKNDRRQALLLRIGAFYDSFFGIPLFFAPIATTQLFGLIVPPDGIGTLWLRLDGVFLIIVSMFYLVTALDPSRYLGNVIVCVIGKIWSVAFYSIYVFMFGAPVQFMFFAILDFIFFFLHIWALGPDRWHRVKAAFRPADLNPGV